MATLNAAAPSPPRPSGVAWPMAPQYAPRGPPSTSLSLSFSLTSLSSPPPSPFTGKGSYGIVCSAVDTLTGSKVAIKKINNVFDHVSDATRILREIKLLRLLKPRRKPGELDLKTRLWRRLARVVGAEHETNASGNNQSQR